MFYFLHITWDRKKRFLSHEDLDILVLIRPQFLLKIDTTLSYSDLDAVFEKHANDIELVIHFAAKKAV